MGRVVDAEDARVDGETLGEAGRVRFCTGCGAQLVQDSRPAGYDAVTGRPRVSVEQRCPRYRWWNAFFGCYHD